MLTKIFCDIDDFMQDFEKEYRSKLIESGAKTKSLNSKLSMSEVMTIVVMYHAYGNRTFKDFYTKNVQTHLNSAFPNLVAYNRFIELIPSVLLPLIAFLKLKRLVSSNDITFIDSTKIAVCHNKRIKRNKVFEGLASTGKSTMGWFHGFKLHIAINERGELCGAIVSKANVDDRNIDVINSVLQGVNGKLYADKGYISQKLFDYLFDKGITLITSIRKNMKQKVLTLIDKILLRKRSLIETVNDQLKNICDIEHSRHRSKINFMVNMVAGLVRYTYFEKNPSLKFTVQERAILSDAISFNVEDNRGIIVL